jgi:uncharacterized protein DUF5989
MTYKEPLSKENNAFSERAAKQRTSLFKDFWDFLRQNRKWWLLPILICLLLLGVLIVLGSTAAAPFIYTLF